jgi:hypothetical protein
MLRPELLNGPRPAQVIDFLNEGVAVPVALRSMYQVLRVAVGVEALDVPAVPPVLTQAGSSDELSGRPEPIGDVAASTQLHENVNLQLPKREPRFVPFRCKNLHPSKTVRGGATGGPVNQSRVEAVLGVSFVTPV